MDNPPFYNEDSISALYHKYVDLLYNWGKTYTSNNELIKDCIQDLFAHLLNRSEVLKNVKNIKVYLFTALQNNIIRETQKNKTLNYYDGLHVNKATLNSEVSISVEDTIIHHETKSINKEKIKKLIHDLPYRQKRAIFLRYKLQMDYDEICSILEIDYQSARTLIYRAIKNLHHNFYQE